MRKDYIFTQETFIPRPLNDVFKFFSKAENLERLTPPKLKFNILTATPIAMQKGALIEYRIRLLGLPFKWRTEITLWDPPVKFQDIQLKGPYKKWQHTHRFKEVRNGTQMTDDVVYQLPFSAISALFVKKQIASIFAYRKEQLDTLFPNTNE